MALCIMGIVTCVMWGERDAERALRSSAESRLAQTREQLMQAQALQEDAEDALSAGKETWQEQLATVTAERDELSVSNAALQAQAEEAANALAQAQTQQDEFETNEIMYPKVEAGSSAYDVVCPSDYMVQKMIENDLIQELDYDKIPNAKENIGAQYYEQAAAYDPGNKYCVPYCWGTVGIIYNKTMVDTPPTKWADLWDEKYADNILMMDSIKDSFMVALKKNGFSSNSLDESELQIATNDLIAQKPLVQAYVVDQVRDKMIGGEAAIGVMFSGDAIYVIGENPDLDYVIPEEGTNVWIDGWVIPKNAPNKENAEKFIDFMCRPDVALKNFEYITYGTPNTAARELIEDEDLKNSPIAFPDLTQYNNLETFLYLGEDGEELFNKYWKEVMSN